jgi:hypothetical protein
MTTRLRFSGCFAALVAAGVWACGGPATPTPTTGPITIGGASVTVALAAAALGSDCGSQTAGIGGACAAGVTNCGVCQQSTLQLKVTATGSGGTTLQVTAVRVADPKTGEVLQALTARSPQTWSGSAYAAWDQMVAAPVDLSVTYDLSAPDWTKISPAGYSQTTYRVEADVVVGGATRTVSVDGVTREAPIST